MLFFFSLIFFIFSIKVQAKNYDDQNFICADEIGPILEFHIPKFKDSKNIKDIIFKLFKKENRNQYIKKSGTIQKKSSPIDNTYFHYEIKIIFPMLKKQKMKNLDSTHQQWECSKFVLLRHSIYRSSLLAIGFLITPIKYLNCAPCSVVLRGAIVL